MKPVDLQTDEMLRFAIADINEAISANPETDNLIRYIQERDACKAELIRRQTKRLYRRMLRENLHDPLEAPFRGRHWVRARNGNVYDRDRWRSAAWRLASFRRYGV